MQYDLTHFLMLSTWTSSYIANYLLWPDALSDTNNNLQGCIGGGRFGVGVGAKSEGSGDGSPPAGSRGGAPVGV